MTFFIYILSLKNVSKWSEFMLKTRKNIYKWSKKKNLFSFWIKLIIFTCFKHKLSLFDKCFIKYKKIKCIYIQMCYFTENNLLKYFFIIYYY